MRCLVLVVVAFGENCSTATTHSCYTKACPAGLGPTTCFLGGCQCKVGTCAGDDGVCRPSIANFCSQDTGGTCVHAECENFRGPTDCYNGKCFCKKGFCADTTGVCQPSGKGVVEKWTNELNGGTDFTCKVSTGGGCILGGCLAGRGPTTCTFGSCVCSAGSCSDDQGICHPVMIPDACGRETGGTCSKFPCDEYRGPTECSGDKKCLCKPGYCTDSTGVCKPTGETVYNVAGTIVGGSDGGSLAELVPEATTCGVVNNWAATMLVALVATSCCVTKANREEHEMMSYVKQVVGVTSMFILNQMASQQVSSDVGGSQCSWFAVMTITDFAFGLVLVLVCSRVTLQSVSASNMMLQSLICVGIACVVKAMSLYGTMVAVDIVMPMVKGISEAAAGMIIVCGVAVNLWGTSQAVTARKWDRVSITEPLIMG